MPTPAPGGRPGWSWSQEKKAIRTTITVNQVVQEWAQQAIE